MKLQKSFGKRKSPKLPFVRRVSGTSMMPRYRQGQIVVAWPSKNFAIGDTIVLLHDGREKIKRIAAIDNETVYILGDNAQASTDSRHFGWIASSCIRGKIIWPL